jgi:anti-sigma B factor antagonist
MDVLTATYETDGLVVVELVGDIDAHSATNLRERLLTVVARQGRDLVLHMGGVEFLDSAGINALVSVRRRVLLLGGSIRLAALQPGPERVIRICGLDRVFSIHDTVAEAISGPGEPAFAGPMLPVGLLVQHGAASVGLPGRG